MARSRTEGPFEPNMEHFPVLEIISPSVALYDTVRVQTFFECVDLGLRRNVPFAVLHDARDIPPVDELQRHEFLGLLEVRRREIEARVVGYAAIVSSPFERGLVTAYTWFVKLALPLRLFTNEREARAWLAARNAQAVHEKTAPRSAPLLSIER